MNRKPVGLTVVLISTFAASLASGQSTEDRASRSARLLTERGSVLDEFHLSYLMGFNISARVRSLGSTPAPITGKMVPPSVTGVTYRDGFVGQDISGNFQHLTTYWGYADNNQIVGDNLLLSTSGPGTLLKEIHDNPQHGLEVGYRWRYRESSGSKMGMEAAFSFMDLDLHANGDADPSVMAVDAFSLGGIIPPQAPYFGSVLPGTGPLIDDRPTRYPVHLVSEFDGKVFGFKFGPYAVWPLSDQVWLGVNGGFSLLLHDSDFRFERSVIIPGQPTISSVITDSDLGVLPGFYIGGGLSYKVSDSVRWFTNLQYQNNGRHSHDANGIRAEINFEEALFLSVGFSYLY